MATLYLVRHSQASFGMDNYDELSSMGLKQSAIVGKHFTKNIDALYRGSMKRHQQTAEIGFPDMQAVEFPALNEFDHENVFSVHWPDFSNKEKAIMQVMSQPNPKEYAETQFRQAMLKWALESEDGPSAYTEPYSLFKSRCMDVLQQIMAHSRKEKHKEVVVVTSGMFISVVMLRLLEMPIERMVDISMNVANTSVTSILFNDHKITLNYFNNYSHLPAEMVSMR